MRLPLMGRSTGLVVRDRAVELLVMQGWQVVSNVRMPLEGSESRHLTEAIQQLVASAQLKNPRVAVALPTKDALFRFFTIPTVSKHELEGAVQFEVRKYLPFKTEQLIWDFETMPSSTPNRLDVIFGAILKEGYDRIRDALTAAGLQPVLIEPRSLSLARLVKQPKSQSANEFVCLVEIEPEAAHLAIIKNRVPYLTRDINLTPVSDAPASDSLGNLPPAGLSVVSSGMGQTGAADPRVQRLLSELSVSMDFFTREYPSTSIRQIFLLGEDSLVASWSEWLSARLHCQVASGRTFIESHVRGGVPLTSAAGVGVIEAARNPHRYGVFNFLKRGAMSKTKTPEASTLVSGLRVSLQGVQGSVLATIMVGLLLSLWFYGAMGVAAQRRQLAHLVRSQPDVGWGLSAMAEKELDQVKGATQARMALLKSTMDERTRVSAKLDALARALPDGMWLTGLLLEDRLEANGKGQPRLVLNGACFLGESGREIQTIQSFEQRVKSHATFFQGFHMTQLDQMSAPITSQQPTAHRTFQLTCNSSKERS